MTIREISKLTGVSVATVSRALNNRPRVSAKTRQKVLAAVQRFGYTPNASARTLSMEKTNTIGVILHQISSGFYATVMAGIELEARARELHVLITLAHRADPERIHHYDMLDEARVDGLIVLDSTLPPEGVARLASYKRPVVMIQKRTDDPAISTVSANDAAAARTALQHLLGLGYRDLVLVAGPPEAEDSALRMQGCREALEEAGLYLKDIPVIQGSYSADRALAAFREFRGRNKLPRAVFAFNDDMALAIMKELRLSRVRVPEDVAVMGFDGTTAADYMGLTTMQVPMIEIGHAAVKLLAERIANPKAPAAHIALDAALVVRESCGARRG
ncbi:MAG: LacI family DNA-binding transcriptional regulator [Verrucomicrobiota bacterium]